MAREVPANIETVSAISAEGSFMLSSQTNRRCHSNVSPTFPTAVCPRQLNSTLTKCPLRARVPDGKARSYGVR